MNKLKELREDREMTKEYLAKLAGIPRVTISYLESGKRPMRVQHAKVLAPIFGVSIDYIMGTDAIYYVGMFKDALSNLVDGVFDEMIEASRDGRLDDHNRFLYTISQRLLDTNLTVEDLKSISKFINDILDKYQEVKK